MERRLSRRTDRLKRVLVYLDQLCRVGGQPRIVYAAAMATTSCIGTPVAASSRKSRHVGVNHDRDVMQVGRGFLENAHDFGEYAHTRVAALAKGVVVSESTCTNLLDESLCLPPGRIDDSHWAVCPVFGGKNIEPVGVGEAIEPVGDVFCPVWGAVDFAFPWASSIEGTSGPGRNGSFDS